jgi:hypothetical protein
VQAMIHAIESADSSIQALSKPSQRSFCVTNAIAADNPIVYASPGFMELTGYDMHGILGHNCRLLQGEDTDKNEVDISLKTHHFLPSSLLISSLFFCPGAQAPTSH